MAPECERARGSPQDSICMTTAARFGSSEAALAHFTMSSAQYWICLVKTGEILFDVEATVNSNNGLLELCDSFLTVRFVLSVTGSSGVTTGKAGFVDCGMDVDARETGISLSRADVCSGALSAKIASKQAMNSAASGGIQ